jgi:DNA-binding transcriptional MerR regulator
MFSIGEFARLGAVSIRTLRHYDEIGLLPPAEVDPVTGYRSYPAKQLRQLNRIVALKDLGLTLGQIRRFLDGITVQELRGMLLLRQAQLERELQRQRHHLLGVEARLRHIAQEDDMPADDIVIKQIPPLGVVVIADTAPEWGPENIVPAVNRARVKFDQLGISGLVKVSGPFTLFYEQTDSQEVIVNVALPVAGWTTSPTRTGRSSKPSWPSPGRQSAPDSARWSMHRLSFPVEEGVDLGPAGCGGRAVPLDGKGGRGVGAVCGYLQGRAAQQFGGEHAAVGVAGAVGVHGLDGEPSDAVDLTPAGENASAGTIADDHHRASGEPLGEFRSDRFVLHVGA